MFTRLRPWFLVASLLVTMLMGMYGLINACDTVAFLRSGSIPDETAAIEQAQTANGEVEALRVLANASYRQALADARPRTFPLGVAHILISLLLVAGSAVTLAGRPGAARFMMQVLVASALLAIADYVLTRDMRAHWAAILGETAGHLPYGTPPDPRLLGAINLVVRDLGTFGAAFLAIRSHRSRVFFETAARADEQQLDDEDDL